MESEAGKLSYLNQDRSLYALLYYMEGWLCGILKAQFELDKKMDVFTSATTGMVFQRNSDPRKVSVALEAKKEVPPITISNDS